MHDSAAINLWFVLARAVHFGSCLLLLGTFFFDRFVAAAVPLVETQWKSIACRLILLSLGLSLLTGAWWFGFVATEMAGLPPGQAFDHEVLAMVWNQTRFGQVWKLRLAAWMLGAIVAVQFIYLPRRRARSPGAWLGIVTGGLLVASLAWAGHGQNGSAHLVADVLHLLVSAVWPAGLLPLALLLMQLQGQGSGLGGRGSRRAESSPTEESRLGRSLVLPELGPQSDSISLLVRRFSLLSILAVLLLTATGIVNTWVLVGSVSNLLSTRYGRVLLLKIALFAAMIVLGAINLLYLKPRLATRPQTRLLQINVSLEVLLAAAVLGVVGLLGLLEPAVM